MHAIEMHRRFFGDKLDSSSVEIDARFSALDLGLDVSMFELLLTGLILSILELLVMGLIVCILELLLKGLVVSMFELLLNGRDCHPVVTDIDCECPSIGMDVDCD